MKTSLLVFAFLGLLLLSGLALGAYFVATTANEEAPVAASFDESDEPDEEVEGAPTDEPETPEPGEEPETPAGENGEGADPSHTTNAGETEGESGPTEVEAGPSNPEAPATEKELEDLIRKAKEDGGLAGLDIKDLLRRLKEDGLEGVEIEGVEIGGDGMFGKRVPFKATVSGTVRDASGNPVADADIYVDIMESFEGSGFASMVMLGGIGSKVTTSDAAGNWTAEIDRTAGEKAKIEATFKAKAKGYAESKGSTVTLKNEDVKSGVKLTMRGAGSVTGRVVDENGQGLEGVNVSLSSAGNSPFGGMVLEFYGQSKNSAKTDSGGNYTIEGVAEGRYRISVNAAGFRQKSGPTEVDVKPGEIARLATDFTLGVTASLRFTLVNLEGKPVRGYASIKLLTGGAARRHLGGMADENGLVVIGDPPVGTFEVEIKIWGYTSVTRTITFHEGRPTDIGEIMLQKDENTGSGWGEDPIGD